MRRVREPREALVAGQTGLEAIEALAEELPGSGAEGSCPVALRDRRRPGGGHFGADQGDGLCGCRGPLRPRGPRPCRHRAMTEIVSVEADGPDTARSALEGTVGEGGGRSSRPTRSTASLAIRSTPVRWSGSTRSRGATTGSPRPSCACSPLAIEGARLRTRRALHQAVAQAAAGPRNPGFLPTRSAAIRSPRRDDPRAARRAMIEGPLAGTMTPIFQTSANRSGGPGPAGIQGDQRRGGSQPRTWRSTAGGS